MNLADKIEHVVVVMLENRSFDNLLGLLPHPSHQFRRPPSGWFNPSGPEADAARIEMKKTSQDVNGPGPGHHHASALRQLTGPWTEQEWNAFGPLPWQRIGPLWADLVAREDTNRGFYWDFRNDVKHGEKPYKSVMGMWGEEDIPALWALALEYGVCQRWFCPLPGQTQPNRHFAMCGTSFGAVDNGTPVRLAPRDSSVFARLRDKGVARAFFGDITSLTPLICRDVWDCNRGRKAFYDAAEHGRLPGFSFVEANNLPRGQSQHPGFADGPECLWRGDAFIGRVYNKLRSNWGQWQKTLLIITWDEHGGFPDHVPPERRGAFAVDADPGGKSAGFDFTLLGPRVPAIVASPWIQRAALDDEIRDHTSILATVRAIFDTAPLGDRDAVMPDLGSMLSDEIVGGPDRLPSVPERVSAPIFFKMVEEDADESLDSYQVDLMRAMLETASRENANVYIDKPVEDLTVAEAVELSKGVAPAVGARDTDIDVE